MHIEWYYTGRLRTEPIEVKAICGKVLRSRKETTTNLDLVDCEGCQRVHGSDLAITVMDQKIEIPQIVWTA